MEETITKIGQHKWTVFEKDGFSIQKINVDGEGQLLIKGYGLPQDAYTYKYQGIMINDKKYGKQLNVQFCSLYINEEAEIIKYLTQNISGVGKRYAKALFKAYGNEVFKKAQDFDAVRVVVKSDKKALKISKSAKEKLVSPEMFELISKYQIKPKVLNSGLYTYEQIRSNPFLLSGKVPFFKLNRMAIDFNTDLQSFDRIKAAVHFVLNEFIGSQGHMYCFYDDMFDYTTNLLNKGLKKNVPSEVIKASLKKMYLEKEIILKKIGNKIAVYSVKKYEIEECIAKKITALLLSNPKKERFSDTQINSAISYEEKNMGIQLAEKQKIAVNMVMKNNISIITGSAGTGKTTVLKTAINVFESLYGCESEDILLLAPTGRAAQRMSVSTGHYAQTVHSRLRIDEDGNLNDEAKIDEKIVFIDEMSMTDAHLLSTIFSHCEDDTKFVFLGDPNQLPSVGAGNILEDCILSSVIPTTKLDVIHRQAEDSLIIKNALNILKGNSSVVEGSDYKFIRTNTIKEETINAFLNELKAYENDVMSVQIIVPMKTRGDYCQEQLNLAIQQAINPVVDGDIFLSVNNYKFHKGDKVICQKNNNDTKNGDIGIITDVYRDEDNVIVADIDFYGITYTYSADQLRDLKFVLAYAITIHKSQGSEFPSVLMPVGNEHMCMLQRNLMYTAVTRASKKMTLVGSEAAYKRAVEKNEKKERLTGLKKYLVSFYKTTI